MAKIKKFEWVIDMEDESHGVKAISFVDMPAMESDFIKLNKQEHKPKFIKLEVEGYKNVLAGLALIPDKEIPRVDPDTGEDYVGYFTASTIEDIRNKFHKEQQDQNVNTNHDEGDTVDAYMISDYIVTSDLQVEDLRAKGIEEAVIGSWYVEYKVEEDAVFEEALENEINGFSVELYADKILTSFKYNNYNKNKFSMKNLLMKFKEIINEFEKEEEGTNLERATIPELEIIIEWGETGEAVNKVVTDEAGEESTEPIEDGDYVLEDGRVLVVAEGVLSEIKEAAEEAPAEEEAEVKAEVEEEAEVKAEEEEEEDDGKDTKKTLEELIDLTTDGYYTVEVEVYEGKIQYGSVYASTWKTLNFASIVKLNETMKGENDDLKREVEELKAKIKEPVTDPKLGFDQEEVDDFKPKNNYERIAHKNGLPVM